MLRGDAHSQKPMEHFGGGKGLEVAHRGVGGWARVGEAPPPENAILQSQSCAMHANRDGDA